MSTMNRVRQAIDPAHQAIEQTEFSKSLLDGRITRANYCQYLTQMWHIHYQLEHKMPMCTPVANYFTYEMIRTSAIARDLFAMGSIVELQTRLPETQRIEEQFATWANTMPFALLGCLYILEGSRMGSLVIGRALIKSLHLVADQATQFAPGVEYHLHNASQTPKRVMQLKSAIDAANLSAAEELELTTGACVFMDMLNALYQKLPVQSSPSRAGVAVCPVHSADHANHLKSA